MQDSKLGSDAQSQQQAQQQAHPGMAAAAMAAATNMASQFVGRASTNQSQNASSSSSSNSSSIGSGSNGGGDSTAPGGQGLAAGDAKIPWRQIAGLLHGQGITDPQGLVSLLLLPIIPCINPVLGLERRRTYCQS